MPWNTPLHQSPGSGRGSRRASRPPGLEKLDFDHRQTPAFRADTTGEDRFREEKILHAWQPGFAWTKKK